VTRPPHLLLPALALLLGLAAGCAQIHELTKPSAPDAAPKPAAPQITEAMLRERAREQLAAGVKQYESGEYEAALKSLQGALDHGLLSKQEQSIARKNLAFVHCVQNREAACRDEFRKAFEIYPDFALSAAEDGHPIWGPVYRNVRTQLITEREAAQARTRPIIPLSKSEQMLADGLVKYGSGDYDAALKLLEAALKEGLPDKGDRIRAQKHVAFSHCLRERIPQCRAAFTKIFEIEPAFDLLPAEAGHPSWTRTFAAVKAQQKKAQAERAAKEAREKAAKEKAAKPPVAAVPKKN
jgi:tetratricopeptide (TPR) repeat protein